MKSKFLFLFFVVLVQGCSYKNLREPDPISPWKTSGPVEPLKLLSEHYSAYQIGAAKNHSVLGQAAIAGAGVSVIGAAAKSHSRVYKSSAAIIATALGFDFWGNFAEQRQIYSDARTQLDCAIPHVEFIEQQKSSVKGKLLTIQTNRSKNIAAIEAGFASAPAGTHTFAATIASDTSRTRDVSPMWLARAEIATDDAISDISRAEDISNSLRQRVLLDVGNLQKKVEQQIADRSFKTEETIKIITKPRSGDKAPGDTEDANFVLLDASDNATLHQARQIINAFNEYEKCIAVKQPNTPGTPAEQ